MAVKKRHSTRLGKKNIFLGDHISYYHLCDPSGVNKKDVYYSAAERVVRFRVPLSSGESWFYAQPFPQRIRTVDRLLMYLARRYGCVISNSLYEKLVRTTVEIPQGETPLTDDMVIESVFGDDFAARVATNREIIFRKRERLLIEVTSVNGKSNARILLRYIPKYIVTKEQLIRYANKHGVFFFHSIT